MAAASEYSTVVQQLYVAYFGRPADTLGALSYAAALSALNAPTTLLDLEKSSNASIKTLINSFGTSAESIALYGTDTIAFVKEIYKNLLGRPADFDGLVYWATKIDAGELSKAGAAISIMAGALTNKSVQGLIDAQVIANKVAVATNFTNSIDTSEELVAYTGNTAAAAARAMLAAVTSTTDTTAFQTTVTSTLSDLTTTHNTASVAGSTFTLTTKPDGFTGTTKNDTFNAADGTFTSLDTIDGGKGNDVLNIASTSAFTVPTSASVTNIETVNITSAAGVTIDTTSGWTGLTTLNVTNTGAADTVTAASTTAIAVTGNSQASNEITVNGGSTVNVTATGATGGDVTVGGTTAAAGAVTISSTQTTTNAQTGGAIHVTGGTTVSITSLNAGAGLSVNESATQGNIFVTGNSSTTAVTVIQSGIVARSDVVSALDNTNNTVAGVKGNNTGAVTIADANANSTTAAATITAVTLQNYGDSTISSNKLSTLTLSGTGVDTTGTAGSTNITGTLSLRDKLTTPTVNALTLNLGGGSIGAITSADNYGTQISKFATLNAVLTANTTLASFNDTALRTLAISGTSVLTLSTMNTALTSLTVSGAAGFTGDLSDVSGITSFTAANTTANNTVILKSTTQTYTGGSGNDKVTISADATKVITGGAGTDTLVLNAAGTNFTSAKTGTNVTGFEILAAGADASGTFNVRALGGSAFTKLQASAAVTFSNVTAGTALEILASGTAVNYQTSDTTGADNAVTVTLTGIAASAGTGTKGYTTASLELKDANSIGIGNVTIVTDASVGGGVHTISVLTDSALKNLAITGTGALVIGTTTTSATSYTLSDNNTSTADSGITLLNAANLANLSYSGTHAFKITELSDNGVSTAIITNANTGSTGVLTIGTFSNSNLTSLTLNGSVAITTGTFTNASGVTISASTNNQKMTITTGAGADVITLGSGANNVTAGAGADTVTFGTHTSAVTFNLKAVAPGNPFSGTGGDSAAFVAPSTNTISTTLMDVITGMKAGDKIQLSGTAYTGQPGSGAGVTTDGVAATTLVSLAVANNTIEIVRGTYDATAHTFVGSSTGADSLFVYDSNATTGIGHESIVLVGYVASSVTGIGGASGLVTLA